MTAEEVHVLQRMADQAASLVVDAENLVNIIGRLEFYAAQTSPRQVSLARVNRDLARNLARRILRDLEGME